MGAKRVVLKSSLEGEGAARFPAVQETVADSMRGPRADSPARVSLHQDRVTG